VPYGIETADGIQIDNIPDEIPRDSDQLKARVQQARMQRHQQSPEFQAKVAAQREADRALYDPTAGMSVPEKLAANWSAGYGNLQQGIDQLLGKIGIGPGVTDEQIAEKRARDAQLAASLPYWGKAAQTTSEVLPTLAIPTGAIPARVAGTMLGPATRLLAGSAAGSATQAALSPVTSDESRPLNMTTAAVLGAAIPGAGMAAPAAVSGGRKLLTEAGSKARALEIVADALGPEGKPFLDRLGAYEAPTLKGQPVDIPTSAAQATGDARIAQLEAASRSRPSTQPDWADFDAAQAAQRFDLLQQMTPSPLRLQRLDLARDLATGGMREGALTAAGEAGNFAEPVLQHAQTLLEGASGANPAVKTVAKYVSGELGDDAAGAITPARLYEVRKVLASKLSGPSAIGDDLSAAAKGAQRETRGMIEAIDASLDAASQGQWRPYLSEYASRSQPVQSAAAMQGILGKIEDKPLIGSTPQMTYAGVSQAARQFGEGQFGSKLTPEAGGDVQALLDHLRQSEAASRTRKLAATQGGGSITNTDQQLAQTAAKMIEGAPVIGGYAKRVREYNADQVDRILAQLLQDPQALGPQLRALIDAGGGTSARRQLLEQALRASGQGASAGATAP
jgi:hypothetical protein